MTDTNQDRLDELETVKIQWKRFRELTEEQYFWLVKQAEEVERLRVLREKMAKVDPEANNLLEEIESLTKELDWYKDANLRWQKNYDNLKEELEAVKTDRNELKQYQDWSEVQMAEDDKAFKKLEAENARQKENRKLLGAEIAILRNNLKATEEINEKHVQDYLNLAEENAELKEKVETFKDEAKLTDAVLTQSQRDMIVNELRNR